jgi:Tfp pilus assembly protein FimT
MNSSFARMLSGVRDHGRPARVLRRAAFTITELLVVITLIVILVLIAVPSFQSMIYSSEEGMTETQVRTAIRAARDAAIRSNGGADGAAVFFFEPGGRCTIVPCVKVGEMTDWFSAAGNDTVRREIFAAAPGFSPVQLPRTWMVRGYVSANSFTNAWYGSSTQEMNDATLAQQRNWMFPETGFFDTTGTAEGFKRSTFMVRFQAGTGALVGASTEPALVLAPRNSGVGRTTSPFNIDPQANKEGREDPVQFVRTWLAKPVSGTGVNDRRAVLGRRSSDMVLARPVMQIAVYNEQKLAAALGARLDSTTSSLYVDPAAAGYLPEYVMATPSVTLRRIDMWIEGDTNIDGTVSNNTGADRPEAKLFAIDRLTGVLRPMEVQP